MGIWVPPAPSGTDPDIEAQVRRDLMVGMPLFATTLEEDIASIFGAFPGDGVYEAIRSAMERDIPSWIEANPEPGKFVRSFPGWDLTFVSGFGATDPNRYSFTIQQNDQLDPLSPEFGWPPPLAYLFPYAISSEGGGENPSDGGSGGGGGGGSD